MKIFDFQIIKNKEPFGGGIRKTLVLVTQKVKLFFLRVRYNFVHKRERYFFVRQEFGYEFAAAAR